MKVTSALSDRSVDCVTITEHITSGHQYASIIERIDQKNTQGEKYFKYGELVLAQKNEENNVSEDIIYLLKEPFQFVCELTEVSWGNEAKAGLFQAVSGQLNDLVVCEAEDAISQRQDILRGVALDDLLDVLLHLSCGLKGGEYKPIMNSPIKIQSLGTEDDRLPWEIFLCTHDSSW